MEKSYTADEVAEHSKETDLWMTMHGGVYDLTEFLSQHPGGEEVLMKLAGQDGTVCFDEIGHSGEAVQLKESFKIGALDGAAITDNKATSSRKNPEETTVDDDDWAYEEPKKQFNPNIPIFIGIAVLIYAALFYYIF